MEIRLTKEEVKYAVAVHLFTKTGMRLETDEFDIVMYSKDIETPIITTDGLCLKIKED